MILSGARSLLGFPSINKSVSACYLVMSKQSDLSVRIKTGELASSQKSHNLRSYYGQSPVFFRPFSFSNCSGIISKYLSLFIFLCLNVYIRFLSLSNLQFVFVRFFSQIQIHVFFLHLSVFFFSFHLIVNILANTGFSIGHSFHEPFSFVANSATNCINSNVSPNSSSVLPALKRPPRLLKGVCLSLGHLSVTRNQVFLSFQLVSAL